MSDIKTLLLDADGVLIRAEMSSRYFEEKYGIQHETTVGFYRGPFQDALVGKLDMYNMLPQYLQEWGWQKTPQDFVQEWFDYENKVDRKIVDYLQTVRQKGIKCYVATNQERHRAQYMLDHMGFANDFDGLFASAHLGEKKPDQAFFASVLERLNIEDKSSVLFWDDDQPNIGGAREFGINAEFYTDFNDFCTKLEQNYNIIL